MTSMPVRQRVIARLLARTDPDLTVIQRSSLDRLHREVEARRAEAAKARRRLGRVQKRLTRLTEAVWGEGTDMDGRVRRTAQTFRESQARATLVDELVAGSDATEAMVKTARAMLDAGERYSTLLALAEAAAAARVGRGVPGVIEALAASSGKRPRDARVVEESSRADERLVRRWALPQVIGAALATERTDVSSRLLTDLSATPTGDLVTIAEMLLGHGDWAALHDADQTLDQRELTTVPVERVSMVRA